MDVRIWTVATGYSFDLRVHLVDSLLETIGHMVGSTSCVDDLMAG